MKHFIYLLVFLMSCQSTSKEKNFEKKDVNPDRVVVNKQKAEVMEIHDVAMEKMGEMVKLKKTLKEQKAFADTSKIAFYNKAIQDLEEADKIMWDWMHQYKTEIVDTSSVESALKYLADQKIKVDIVDLKIKESLKNGYALIEN